MGKSDNARALLARNIKRLREALGLSQAALAKRVGCSTALIGNIETLRRFPSVANIDRISFALGVPVYELFIVEPPRDESLSSSSEVRDLVERRVLSAIREVFAPS